MRLIIFIAFIAAIACGGWYLWEKSPTFRTLVEENTSKDEFKTLQVRFTPDTLMQAHKNELIKTIGSSFLEPKLQFHPYLLMKVKYAKDANSTQEGTLLFALTDGEMVLDGRTWDKTHGYQDCIQAKTTPEEFKVLRCVIESGGQILRDEIYKKLNDETKLVDKWIESCRAKKLLVSTGNALRLHFANPKLTTTPLTFLEDDLVTITSKNLEKTKRNYSVSDIKNLAMAAFGEEFAIKSLEEVFLPVYSLAVQNPDGSILSTTWNGLTGKRIE